MVTLPLPRGPGGCLRGGQQCGAQLALGHQGCLASPFLPGPRESGAVILGQHVSEFPWRLSPEVPRKPRR